MSRSLNKVILIGNLTRDPELKYIPQGAAVCTFGLATNRTWTTDSGEKKDEVEFFKIVAWRKLAEICAQYLTKGKQVYLEGRLQTRKWTGQDGTERTTVEVVLNEMLMLGSRSDTPSSDNFDIPEEAIDSFGEEEKEASGEKSGVKTTKAKPTKDTKKKPSAKKSAKPTKTSSDEDDDIPF
ncbi:single-stranded DNA-binding protein [Patescibacteria group bacterium]|nr:single-stranded DNA-binding protein [Patescibacteria group bacterium]